MKHNPIFLETIKSRAFAAAEQAGSQASQGRITLAKALADSTNKTKFDILENAGNVIADVENRLSQNDTFFVTSIGFFLANAANDAALPIATRYSYINDELDPSTATGLEGLFNQGNFQFNVGTNEVIPGLPLIRFKHAPEAQKGTVIATDGQSAGTTYAIQEDQFDFESVYLDTYPVSIVFDGGKNQKLFLNHPALTLAPGSGSNYVIMDFQGFVVPGGSEK